VLSFKEGTTKAFEHGGKFFRFRDKLVEARFTQKLESACDVELRAQFAAGSFRNVQKMREIFCASALRAFGNVRRHRERGGLNLVPQREAFARSERSKDLDRQSASTLPNLKILK
jgi:hypothetical protein